MEALQMLINLLNTAANATMAAHKVSLLIQNAKSEGRDVTLEELQDLALQDDQARKVLQDAIDEARASGADPD